MESHVLQAAELLAADLAGARVDPNEAQKALAYLRSKKDGKLFFDYLRAINQNGRAVIRSGQTLGYYRDLLAASERHLRKMNPEEMAQTLGWAIRLLRYYRAVPNPPPDILPARRPAPSADTSPVRQQATPTDTPTPRKEVPVTPAKPAAPQIPAVGDIFGGEVLLIEPQGVRVRVKNLSEDTAIGIIKTANLEGKKYQLKNIARVEVISQRTLSSGLVVLDCKPAPKKEK